MVQAGHIVWIYMCVGAFKDLLHVTAQCPLSQICRGCKGFSSSYTSYDESNTIPSSCIDRCNNYGCNGFDFDSSTDYCRFTGSENFFLTSLHQHHYRRSCNTDCMEFDIAGVDFAVGKSTCWLMVNFGYTLVQCLERCFDMPLCRGVTYSNNGATDCNLYTCTIHELQPSGNLDFYYKVCNGETTPPPATVAPTTTTTTPTTTTITSTTTTTPTTTTTTTTTPTTTTTTTTPTTTTTTPTTTTPTPTTTTPTPTTTTTTPTTTTTTATITTTTPTTTTTTSAPTTAVVKPIYLWPCRCATSHFFANLTMDQIVAELIKETAIDLKNTSLAQSKLKCRQDPRTSATATGMVGIFLLAVVFVPVILMDVLRVKAHFLRALG